MASKHSERAASHCVDCGKTHPPRAVFIPSPFQSIIAQEIFPTASETAAIRDFVQDTDAEIAWREGAIDRLLCEVGELRRRSEQHKVIIAPIRRVPPEIMAEIFLQLAAIEAEIASHSSYSWGHNLFETQYMVRPIRHAAPLILCEVSRKWRTIACSMPNLWHSISLKCTNEKLQTNISLCDMWLKRSGSLPLSIRLYRDLAVSSNSEAVTEKTIDNCQNLLVTILPYSNRWRFLDLEYLPLASYNILNGRLPDSLPLLQTLSVAHDRWAESWPMPARDSPWPGLRTAPKLRFLYLSSIGSTDAAIGEWQTFPWSQLTHIEVAECSAYDCLQILSQASTAVACRFIVQRNSYLQHPPISHSGLQTLEIEVYGDLRLLWNCLTCPALSTLSITTEDMRYSYQGLPSFITRSGTTIEDFTLKGATINSDEFLTCLAGMPHLRHLEVTELDDFWQFTDEVWGSLTWSTPNSPPPLIPNLESLELGGGNHFSHRSVVKMLESRVRTADSPADFVPNLQDVDLTFWRKMSLSACQRLKVFRKLGLNIHVEHSRGDEGGEDGSAASEDEGDSG